MNLDAVHEMPSFGDQTMMTVHNNNIMEENTKEIIYEAAYSYDELFPSLPDNEQKPEVPVVDMGQWTQKMKVKSSVITQVFHVPVEERKYRDMNNQRFGEQGEQSKICTDIMQKTGTHIEISSCKDQSLTILVTGKEEAVLKARRLIVKELQTQANATIPIPKEHHRFILGKSGKKLADLELNTATKISVPRPDDNSDLIKITGTKDGIDKARHEIELISDEQSKLAFERLDIPKVYHPFIFGPFNEIVNQIKNETGARINIPPPSVMKNELTIAGEKEAVALAKDRIVKIFEERKRNCQVVSVEISKNQHKYIIGHRGQTIQEILGETGVSVEMPPPDSQSSTITLRGEQAQLGPALTLVYSKANSVVNEHLDAPNWLHKYIIGKKGANIKQITHDLTKTQVEFADDPDSIKIEGPPEEVKEACRRLSEMMENLKKEIACEEIKIKPTFHRHIIGKNGATINRLKEETQALINIPSDDSDIVRIEGKPEGVAQVKKLLLAMVHKMENEISRDVMIEQRFHRNIIGAKGEKIREIRDKFNQVNVTFPEPGLKSDKVTIRGPKPDVDGCYKYLQRMHEEMKINNFTIDVPIYKQNHKFIIGKGGVNIKKIRDETNTRIDLPAEGTESDVITIKGRKEDVLAAREKILAIQEELDNVIMQEIMIPAKLHNSIIGTKGRLIRSIIEDCGGVTVKFPSGGTGSDKVSIRGPKEDVLKAKKLLIELSNEKDNVIMQEIMIPAKLHNSIIGTKGRLIRSIIEDCGGVTVKFPSGGTGSDKVSIRGPKEDVLKGCFIKWQMTSFTAEVKAEPDQHKFLIGKNGANIKKVRDKTGARIVFPNEKDDDQKSIVIIGRKEEVEAAKKELNEMIKDLSNTEKDTIDIDPKHHRHFVARRGEVLQQIQDEFGNVTISFPRNGTNESEVTLKGPKEFIKGAKQRLQEIVTELDQMVTVDCIISQEHHRTVLGTRGSKVQNIQKQFNVNIKFPDRQQPDDIEKPAINGEYHPNLPEDNQRNIIKIRGKSENCEAAKQALLDLVPVTEEMEVPYDLHRFIIGQKGKDVRSMMEQYDVNIIIPPQSDQSSTITIKGPPVKVTQTKAALKERIEQLEFEKQDRVLRSFQVTVDVDPQHHPKIIGRGGAVVNKIRKDHNVNINFPEREGANERTITIIGYEKDAEAAKEAILKLVQEQEDMYKEEVQIDFRIHSRIIGSRGRNVLKIMDTYKVDIRFPRSTDPDPDLVVIQGQEDDVFDAKDYLLNLEEEYMQDLKEREFLRQYTHPPSRNGTHEMDGSRTNDKGFVVKGAPWDKSAAPDTTNTQEFPSFGSGGDMPSKPVAWGPSHR